MIVSASYRTDIPALYGAWFFNRLRAGFARVHNPYGGPPGTVPLTRGAVDAFVFWTRNLGPFATALDEVAGCGFPFLIQYTAMSYPRALERATPGPEVAISHIRATVARFGAGTVVWRYDPIVCTTLTPPAWHVSTFARLAQELDGAVDEVIVSWCQIYRKTARNLDAAARASGFTWRDPEDDEKRALLARLAAIAAGHGMRLSLCGQPGLRTESVGEARCIDADRLSRIAGAPLAIRHHAHRKQCGCWASRDIGAYDSCTQGCAYCYAVNSSAVAKRRRAGHDPRAAFLIPATGKPDQSDSSMRLPAAVPPAASDGCS
jgi:hypothetical protein